MSEAWTPTPMDLADRERRVHRHTMEAETIRMVCPGCHQWGFLRVAQHRKNAQCRLMACRCGWSKSMIVGRDLT